jgi:hypothetical protein
MILDTFEFPSLMRPAKKSYFLVATSVIEISTTRVEEGGQ